MDEPTRRVRFEIFQFILDNCRPPTTHELAKKSDQTVPATNDILRQLEHLHHIKLYHETTPSPTPIEMAHPFSHLPTPYVVCQGSRSWWANCAWCAFGLAAMLSPAESTVNMLLRCSGNAIRLAFTVANGELEEPFADYHVTFSPPPARWWDDVRYACSTIQVCESKEEAEKWFAEKGFERGDVLNLRTLWRLSKAWYGDKHLYEYNRKSPDEVKALFQELGMTAAYWTS